MAWTTPKTWNVGEVVTAANMNAQVRDNLAQKAGATKPSVRVTHSAVQNVSTNATNSLNFDTETWDYGSMHVTGSSSHRLKCQTGGDGKYMIGGTVSIAASGNLLVRNAGIEYNSSDGAGTFITRTTVWPPTGGAARLSVTHPYGLAAGDYVSFSVFNGSTSTGIISANAAGAPCNFWATWESA